MHAHCCNGQLLVDGPDSLVSWLNSSQAATLVPCLWMHIYVGSYRQPVDPSINVAIPMMQAATNELDIGGKYWSRRVWALVHGSGRLQLTYDAVALDFKPLWAKALWRGLPLGSEREQILQLLRDTLVSLPKQLVSHHP